MSGTWHVVGGTTFDLFAHDLPTLPRVDEAGDEFTWTSLVHLPAPFVASVGGNAGNAAYAAARLGRGVRLVTALDADLFGAWLRARFDDVGVELIVVPPSETSVNVVATDVTGRRHSLFRPVPVSTADVEATADRADLAAGDIVLLAGYPHPEPGAITAWARAGVACQATVALDVGPAVAGLTANVLAAALPDLDLVFANVLELEVLVRGAAPLAAARRLAEDHGVAVVIKAGAEGATYVDTNVQVHVPAFPVGSKGPTVGAGDAFNAGFLSAWERGVEPAAALPFGAAVAAMLVEGGRGVLGAPNASDVERFLAEHPSPASSAPEPRFPKKSPDTKEE